MARLACVDIPALALQLLLRRHPDWLEHPMAVVDEDRPTGVIEWVNQRAWRQRIRPGMRYAAALSIDGTLRAGVVTPDERAEAIDELLATLKRFSPRVEPVEDAEGTFWLDASGLDRLYPCLDTWADGLHDAVVGDGYRATVVVGFHKYAVYALALARHRRRVLASPAQERAIWLRVPIDRLALAPKVLRYLERMGVRTLAELVALPEAELAQRFGCEAARWHRWVNDDVSPGVRAHVAAPPVETTLAWDHPVYDTQRLMRAIASRLPGLVGELLRRDALLQAITLELQLDRAGVVTERVTSSSPTLDEGLWLDLLQLRLDATPLPTGVVELRLRTEAQRARHEQTSLLEARPHRDLAVANRTLARLRAELGDAAIGVWAIGDGHLPEARMRWCPVETLKPAQPREVRVQPLIRRLQRPALPLPPRARHEPDGWLVRGPEAGPVVRSVGPHVIDGGWWATRIEREYHYLETAHGLLLWTFYDRKRRRWYLEGEVE